MSKNKILTFIILLSISMLFIWIYESAPLIALVVPFIIAACLAATTIYCGYTFSLASLLLVTAFSYLLSNDILSSIFGTSIIAATGIVLGYLILNKKSYISLLIAGAVGFLMSNAGYLLLTSYISGTNPILSFFELLNPNMTNVLEERLINLGLENYATQVGAFYQDYAKNVTEMFPAIIITAAVFMSYVLVFIISIILRTTKSEYKFVVEFSKLKADAITVIIFFISIMATFFITDSILSVVFYNIYVVLQFVLQICGLSLVDYRLKYKSRLPLLIRLLILAGAFFLTLIPLVSAVLLILAAIDSRRDFRRLSVSDSNGAE